jgi:hypothetical protein
METGYARTTRLPRWFNNIGDQSCVGIGAVSEPSLRLHPGQDSLNGRSQFERCRVAADRISPMVR